jgi:membrane protein involved in colicin uptake
MQLGLDSVQELELAIDEMEGISEDGTMMASDNLAREARVRSAYMEWCKEYNKQQNESRFPQFYKNFLEMEVFAKESGKDMVLNEYADFTEEEFAKMTSAKEAAGVAASLAKAKEEADAKRKVAAARAEAEAKQKAEEEEKKKARVEAGRSYVPHHRRCSTV